MVCMHVCSVFFLCCTTVQVASIIYQLVIQHYCAFNQNTQCWICWLLVVSCENRQQPTWILRREMRERWCTCVCAPHFFLCCTTVHLFAFIVVAQWWYRFLAALSNEYHCVFAFGFVYCCARIDNNRREYWEERVRKMVCMCVCSVFFLCCTTVQGIN